jgi:hypothetical protein
VLVRYDSAVKTRCAEEADLRMINRDSNLGAASKKKEEKQDATNLSNH